jgi:NAD+ dependent glucose-6-phosphate dehydrogenase
MQNKSNLHIKKIAIPGAAGTIGTVLRHGLKGFDMTPLNLPEVDARNYDDLVNHFTGHDAVIHLAFRTPPQEKNVGPEYDPESFLMVHNVLQAALNAGVKRVILASSVHADNFREWNGQSKLSAHGISHPDSSYGLDKVLVETLGRYYAGKGLEVICIRFGGVNAENKAPENDFWEHAVWLSHADCVAMITACLHAPSVPDNFSVFYAVSNNPDRIHDTSNPFGWRPL